jgi:hypothetical protein
VFSSALVDVGRFRSDMPLLSALGWARGQMRAAAVGPGGDPEPDPEIGEFAGEPWGCLIIRRGWLSTAQGCCKTFAAVARLRLARRPLALLGPPSSTVQPLNGISLQGTAAACLHPLTVRTPLSASSSA